MAKVRARIAFVAAMTVGLACTPSTSAPHEPEVGAAAEPPPPLAAADPSEGAQQSSTPSEGLSLTPRRGTIKIDERPGGKKFHGVWFVQEGGHHYVLSYRPNPWWRPFEGRNVEVKGELYEPEGQAIMVDHFRVEHIRVLDPTEDDELTSMTGEKEFRGKFVEHTFPRRTKLEGETITKFKAWNGTSYLLARLPDPVPKLGKVVTIKAREVELSNFIARVGGSYLWVVSVEPQ